MSNPKKPDNVKALAGTDRRDRTNPSSVDMPLVESIPGPPDWLPNAHALKEWDRLAPILVANKLLTIGDLATLGHLCALHGKIVQLYAAGEAPSASMIGTLRNLQNDFGLSPVARGKVAIPNEKDKGNPFAANGKKGHA